MSLVSGLNLSRHLHLLLLLKYSLRYPHSRLSSQRLDSIVIMTEQQSHHRTASSVANSHSGSLAAAQEADGDAVGVSSQVCKADVKNQDQLRSFIPRLQDELLSRPGSLAAVQETEEDTVGDSPQDRNSELDTV